MNVLSSFQKEELYNDLVLDVILLTFVCVSTNLHVSHSEKIVLKKHCTVQQISVSADVCMSQVVGFSVQS